MKRKFTVAVIGAGAIAQRRHLPEFASRDDAEVIAVVDPKQIRVKEVAKQFNVPNAFTSYKDALKLKPDLVSVCSPNAFHARQTIDALKAGAHVLCEKPMAVSMKEARAMIAAAKAARRQLMIAHNQRYARSHAKGKEIYDSGVLGKCIGFQINFTHGGPEGWSVDGLDCSFFKKDQAVLGSMADLGVHKLDLLRWLIGEDFAEAAARLDKLDKGPRCQVEDTAFAVLRTTGGALGTLFAGWTYKARGADNSTILYCQKGVLRLEDDPEYSVIVDYPNGERLCLKTRVSGTTKESQNRSGVIDAFVEAVAAGKPVPVTGQDGARSLAAVMACVQSAAKGGFAKVEKV